MATYPYISGQGALTQAFTQLRKGFPPKVDAGYLQRFKIAPANESYIISILRFLGLIDEDGGRVENKTSYFFGSEETFKSGLEEAVRNAYRQVFEEMGDSTFQADRTTLMSWFRGADRTTELVGQRQAATFLTLAALAGHGDVPSPRSSSAKKVSAAPGAAKKEQPKKTTAPSADDSAKLPPVTGEGSGVNGAESHTKHGQDVGLTVRIEVNLPPGGDADTYDAIFASIKKHLMS